MSRVPQPDVGHRRVFEEKLASLGIDVTEHDRRRLWASYLKQVELAAAWTNRLDPAGESALLFRVEDAGS